MYVFQFMDGTWRIALFTNSAIKFETLLAVAGALALYEGIYQTRAEAYAAREAIGALLDKAGK